MKVKIIHPPELILDDFFQVEAVQLQFERFDGQMSPVVRRLNFRRGDSVAALLYNDDRRQLILVNQFKYPTYHNSLNPAQRGWITEVIAGVREGDEAPEAAIRREILEEAGYRVTQLTPVSTFYLSPGGTSERLFLFFGAVRDHDKIAPGGGVQSEAENIRLLHYTPEEALNLLARGEIADAKTIIALMWFKDQQKSI